MSINGDAFAEAGNAHDSSLAGHSLLHNFLDLVGYIGLLYSSRRWTFFKSFTGRVDRGKSNAANRPT